MKLNNIRNFKLNYERPEDCRILSCNNKVISGIEMVNCAVDFVCVWISNDMQSHNSSSVIYKTVATFGTDVALEVNCLTEQTVPAKPPVLIL